MSFLAQLPAEEYSWYCGWDELAPFWQELVPDRNAQVLVPGIGNDGAIVGLFDAGWRSVTAFDYSEDAVTRARALLGDRDIELLSADATNMPFANDAFDAVLDKGVMDAINIAGAILISAAARFPWGGRPSWPVLPAELRTHFTSLQATTAYCPQQQSLRELSGRVELSSAFPEWWYVIPQTAPPAPAPNTFCRIPYFRRQVRDWTFWAHTDAWDPGPNAPFQCAARHPHTQTAESRQACGGISGQLLGDASR